MTNKTIEQYFVDWESDAFGYGYGTGDYPIINALKIFFSLVGSGSYDYQELEAHLGAPVTWLLITALIKDDKINYGTSPRYGFLTKEGKSLQEFLRNKTTDELVELVCSADKLEFLCGRTYCNCDTDQPRCTALNPFWRVPP